MTVETESRAENVTAPPLKENEAGSESGTENSSCSSADEVPQQPKHYQAQRQQPPFLEMQTMTLELVRDICLYIRTGDKVLTPYGLGTLTSHKLKPGQSMNITLEFGGTLYVRHPDCIHKVLTPEDYEQAMSYLDQIRDFQVASMCEKLQCEKPAEGKCTACSFDRPDYCKDNRRRKNRWRLVQTGGSRAPRKATHECDICGQQICSLHKVESGSEYFSMCVDCSHDLNQAEHQLNPHHPELPTNLHRLLCHYTRMTIRMAFVCPHLPQVASRLSEDQKRDSQISLGTSGLGFVGAALGVAGAAAILTPAGPAILLAAVATSATSGTLQATHMSYNKFLSNKDAHQISDRVLGWHGLCLGILRTVEQLRKDLLAESIAAGNKEFARLKATALNNQGVDIWNVLAVGSFATTRNAMTGVGVTSAMGASYSQAISTGLQTIPVVGAAFSVGCMAMDATNIYGSLKTLTKPSEKAVALHHVESSFVHSIPNLGFVQSTVQVVLDAVADLRHRWDQQRKQQDVEINAQPRNAFQEVDALFAEVEEDIQSVG